MNTQILKDAHELSTQGGYSIGALIAVLILGYLLYSLVKPEKF